MKCPQDLDFLRMHAGQLAGEALTQIRDHLAACEACRQAEAELRRLHDVLGAWQVDVGARDLRAGVLAAVDGEGPGHREPLSILARAWRSGAVRAAASVLLGIGLGILAGSAVPTQRSEQAPLLVSAQTVAETLGINHLGQAGITGLPDRLDLESGFAVVETGLENG